MFIMKMKLKIVCMLSIILMQQQLSAISAQNPIQTNDAAAAAVEAAAAAAATFKANLNTQTQSQSQSQSQNQLPMQLPMHLPLQSQLQSSSVSPQAALFQLSPVPTVATMPMEPPSPSGIDIVASNRNPNSSNKNNNNDAGDGASGGDAGVVNSFFDNSLPFQMQQKVKKQQTNNQIYHQPQQLQQQHQPHQGQQQHQQQPQQFGEFSSIDKEVVDRLIKQWAPVVWLAPEEKFMPLSVEEFLQNVHPMDKEKKFVPGMTFEEFSQKSYLVTNAEVDELLENDDSFIFGRNPNEHPVPVYAVANLCNQQINDKPGNPLLNDVLPPVALNNYQRSEITQIPAQTLPQQQQQQQPQYISSTRGPYIPVTIDPLEVKNNTVRRSSRLYPVFQRLRRDTRSGAPLNLYNQAPSLEPSLGLTKYDLSIGETATSNDQGQVPVMIHNLPATAQGAGAGAGAVAGAADHSSMDDKNNKDNPMRVNNFIANLVDNVKFSGNTNNNFKEQINPNLEETIPNLTANKGNKKVPSFHVTYWMFYPYSQGKTMCTLSLGPLGSIPFPAVYGFCLGKRKDIGSHIGDWEHMSLYFNGDAEPEAMYVSAHDAGAYYSYNRLTGSFEFKKQETRKGILQRPNFPKTVTTFNDHPVLFAAKGSHGLWTAPGKHRFVKVARLYDINGFGTPWNTWKAVDITYENIKNFGRSLMHTWLSFKGKWGNPKSKCHPFRRIGLNFCEYTDGPTGIPLKEPHFQCGLSYR